MMTHSKAYVHAMIFTACLSTVANAAIIFDNFGSGDSFSNRGRIIQGRLVGTIGDVNQAASFTVARDVGLTAGQSAGNPWNLRPMDDRYALRVEGRIVPEPAACALFVLGLLGTVATRRSTGI